MAMCGWALGIHGGAGERTAADQDPARTLRCTEWMHRLLEEGGALLQSGATALDVVEFAVRALEDFQDFNAGRGSVLTAAGEVEMDAAIMDGAVPRAGAVAVVRGIRHPVAAARAVLDDGRHVLLGGAGAEQFARSHGLEVQDPSWFVTDHRRRQLAAAREQAEGGTVGAVARDRQGHLAAATSTGGLTNQLPGRIGDSPLVGAGTWARDATAAVSATGCGEKLILCSFAHEVDAAMRHGGLDLAESCRHALAELAAVGGKGGCIAVGASGGVVALASTAVMWRGWIGEGDPGATVLLEV